MTVNASPRLLCILLLNVFFLAGISYAQVDRSGLRGTVTDSSGQLLSQTHIIAVQNATQLRRETISHSNGSYDIPELPVGVYTITFDHDGFKSVTFLDVEQVIGLADADEVLRPAAVETDGSRAESGQE